jgi:hypothetical protein
MIRKVHTTLDYSFQKCSFLYLNAFCKMIKLLNLVFQSKEVKSFYIFFYFSWSKYDTFLPSFLKKESIHSCAGGKESPRLLWNLNVHCYVYLQPHESNSYPKPIYINIVIPSTPDFKRFFTSVFQTKLNLYPMRARCPAHRSLFYCPSNVWWIWQITELLALQTPPISCYVVLLTSRIIILISTQPHACSYTLNQCFPP